MSDKGTAANLIIGSVAFNSINATQPPFDGMRDWKVEHNICQKCGERQATQTWSEGSIAFVHGLYQRWCDLCVAVEQLKHAELAALRIDALRERVAQLQQQPPSPHAET